MLLMMILKMMNDFDFVNPYLHLLMDDFVTILIMILVMMGDFEFVKPCFHRLMNDDE